MRRFLPHIIVLLASIASLAIVWHIEPPIQFKQESRVQRARPDTMPRDFFVRIETPDAVDLTELIVVLEWDAQRLRSPRVWHAPLTQQLKPHTKLVGENQLRLTFRPNPRQRRRAAKTGQPVTISGAGRLARVGFLTANPPLPTDAGAVRIVNAVGVRPSGEEVSLEGLALVQYEPAPRSVAGRKPEKGSSL